MLYVYIYIYILYFGRKVVEVRVAGRDIIGKVLQRIWSGTPHLEIGVDSQPRTGCIDDDIIY